jgi:hypothetical protein
VLDQRPVRIVQASLPDTIEHHAISKDGYLIGDGQVFMHLTNGIRCLVEHGETVTIDPGDPSQMAAARFFALSAGVGTLLHQRKYLPLHCAAIETPGGCVAFAGNAGDGKSTLAASFSGRGFKLFTDDRLTLHARPDAPYLATPSLPVLHLFDEGAGLQALMAVNWPSTVTALASMSTWCRDRYAARRLHLPGCTSPTGMKMQVSTLSLPPCRPLMP